MEKINLIEIKKEVLFDFGKALELLKEVDILPQLKCVGFFDNQHDCN